MESTRRKTMAGNGRLRSKFPLRADSQRRFRSWRHRRHLVPRPFNMRKIMFLDLDGVLFMFGGEPQASALRALERIVRETGADVVLSSPWRFAYDMERMKAF